jgi:hypothetical protein
VFESGQELLRLPKLPIALDVTAVVSDHLTVFRHLGNGMPLAAQELSEIPETLLMIDEDVATLSPWGEVVWQQAKRELYREALLDIWSPKVMFSEKFRDGVEELSSERVSLINERMDQLARCLETNQQYNPRSLDFKKLATPQQSATHEIDAWSDQDARRIFGHFEGQTFVVERLAPKLKLAAQVGDPKAGQLVLLSHRGVDRSTESQSEPESCAPSSPP